MYADHRWRGTESGLQYENPDTGVDANLEGLDDEPPGDDGIAAVINYAGRRSSASGRAQLAAAAQAAEVLVVDAQDDMIGGTGAPKPAVAMS